VLAHVLSHLEREAFESTRLRELRGSLEREGRPASAAIAHLHRLSEMHAWQHNQFFAPIGAALLWGTHIAFAIEGWRRHYGAAVGGWLATVGEFEALSSLSAYRYEHPADVFPEIVEPTPARFESEALGHPLLPAARMIRNDVGLGSGTDLLVVSGSNMSGKSTLLRAIGLNIVLAEAGAPVCAASFSMPPSSLYTSIRVQDSLELGLSYFMAALARLKAIVDAAERRPDRDRVLVYLLDEVLQGTNSIERGIAVRAVARHLLEAGAIGAMTTHDLALADEEPLASAAALVHFTEHVEPNGTMSFDYRLRPGLATSRNALRLMQLIGIDPK